MSLHIVGNPRDYGGDDDPPTHGRDTAMYQDLQAIRERYAAWMRDREKDQLPNDEIEAKAAQIESLLEELAEELNQPL